MKTFIVIYVKNPYTLGTVIINAESIDKAKGIADKSEYISGDYRITELDIETEIYTI